MLSSDGNIVVTSYGMGGVNVHVFRSLKELVLHFVCAESIVDAWGSDKQLTALKNIHTVLTRTIASIEAEREADSKAGE